MFSRSILFTDLNYAYTLADVISINLCTCTDVHTTYAAIAGYYDKFGYIQNNTVHRIHRALRLIAKYQPTILICVSAPKLLDWSVCVRTKRRIMYTPKKKNVVSLFIMYFFFSSVFFLFLQFNSHVSETRFAFTSTP